jgi:prepilin-type processing-associated H-X9-DG protein
MLLPALTRAKLKAAAANCLSNQKQLSLAWSMYTTDNQDKMINFLETLNSRNEIPWRWDPAPKPPTIPPGTSQEEKLRLNIEEGFRQGGLYTYAPNPGIIHCPGDTRARLKVGAGFTWVSISPVGTLNGEVAVYYKVTQLSRTSDKIIFIEENDPRGENLGSWIMNQSGNPNNDFLGSSWIDSPAAFHGSSSTFAFADGHSTPHKWVDPATLWYATTMNASKYSMAPSPSQVTHDATWVARGYATKVNR